MGKKVNYWALGEFMGSLWGEADNVRLRAIAPFDELAIKTAFRQYLIPLFDSLTDSSRALVRNSLAYYLTTRKAPFERLLDDIPDHPLDHRGHVEEHLAWLWEAMFPEQPWRLEDLSEYVEQIEDIPVLEYRPNPT